MKKVFVAILLLWFSLPGFSQKSYLGLSFGASLPKQDFALNSLDENGGYALPGLLLDFSAAYIPDYYFGLAGTMTFGSNVPKVDQLKSDILDNIPEDIPEGVEAIFNYGSWIYTNVMTGPIVTLPIRKISIEARFLAGVSFLMSPPTELTVQTADSSYFQSRNARNVNFGYMAGGGIRYHVKEEYSFRLYADYFSSNASINLTDENSPLGEIATEKVSNYTLKVRTLNIGVGLAYRF